MAEQEFYRLELVVSTSGTAEVKNELRAMDKFIESTRRRGALLSRMEMSPAARLNDRVSEPLRRVEGKLKTLKSTTWEVAIGVRDLATGTLTRISRMARALARTTFSLPTAIAGSAAVYAGVLSPLKAAGQFEQTQIGFETMLGSAEKANQFISDLQDFAAKTPFEFLQLTDASKRLLAFGFSAEQILPMMTAVGNAAAGLGLGAEGIDRITLALGQMRAKSKVSAEEMLQLTEAGIPAWEILAKKMGLTTAQVMKLSEKGLIPAQQAIDALIEGMNQRFPNMMEKQSKSLLGLWSNMKDVFSNKIFLRWGQGLADALKPRFERLNRWIDENETTIARWGERLKEAAESGADWVLRKLEGAFKYINRRYFDNPEFQKLDFEGKINFIIDDIGDKLSKWYDETGKQKIESMISNLVYDISEWIDKNAETIISTGAKLGTLMAKGVLSGFGNFLKETNMEAVENPSGENVGKAILWDAVAAWGIASIAGKVLKPLKPLTKLFKPSKAASNAAEVAAKAGAASTAAAATEASKAAKTVPIYGPRGEVLREVAVGGEAAAATSAAKKPGFLTRIFKGPLISPKATKALRLAGKAAVPVAIGLDAMNIATAQPGEERNKAIGEAVGGWSGFAAGAAAGAAAGSVVPVIGTAAGGLIGGILGSLGGGWIGREVGGLFKSKKVATTPDVSAPKPTVKISEDQFAELSRSFQDMKRETRINVQIPAGAVQVQINESEVSQDELMNKVGIPLVKNIMRAFENRA